MIVRFDEGKEETIYKCKACGYVYAKKFNDDEMYYETTQGEKPFIELGLTTKENNDYFETISEEKLYACPNCGTVHIEI